MEPAVTIGLDIARSVFQIHGVGAAGDVVVRQRLSRGKLLQFFARIPACLVGLRPGQTNFHPYPIILTAHCVGFIEDGELPTDLRYSR